MVLRKCFGEFIGTLSLVLAGTGAIVVDDVSGGTVTHIGVALTFGLVVMTMIYALGDLSGAHLNPAVSIGFWAARRMEGRELLPYIASQTAGAMTASLLIFLTFPGHADLGATLPAISHIKAFAWEVMLTFLLMFVIIHVAVGDKEKGVVAGAAIGSTVCLAALFAGPLTGTSMNPARSLAPALFSLHLDALWIYLTAPFAGALLAIGAWRLLHPFR